jgi:hypothetical protein
MRDALADIPPPATGLRSDVGDVLESLRARFHPLRALALLALVVAFGFGGWQALRLWRANLDENVPTPADAAAGLPAPELSPGQAAVVGEDSEPLFRPLPESPAERWLFAADTQLRAGRLTAPRDDNAYDSLLAAWHADATHPRLGASGGKLVDALAAQAVGALQQGELDRARDAVDRADALDARIAQPAIDDAARRLRRQVGAAFAEAVEHALAARDDAGVQRLLAFARAARLPGAQVAALSARAEAVPKPGDVLPGPLFGGLEVVRHGQALIGVAQHAVSRDDYQRFARATSRPTTLCRERASLLRIVKPRDWQSPGFAQSATDPVVCVSYADAAAYAQWLQKQTGERYRLPRNGEVVAAAGSGEHRVSQWLDACHDGCDTRVVAGKGWRGGDARALDASRGYDDVGFRLVRDLEP